jgi:hypothetical protein
VQFSSVVGLKLLEWKCSAILLYDCIPAIPETEQTEIPTWLQISHVMFPFLLHHLCMHFLCANCIQPKPVQQRTISILLRRIIPGHVQNDVKENNNYLTTGKKKAIIGWINMDQMLETRMFVHAGKQYDRSISSAKRPNTVS